MIDPLGYHESMTTLAQGIMHGVQHPAEFGKALIDYDTWKQSPGRAIGHLVPDLLLGAATGGAGTAAAHSLRGAKALDDVADTANASRRLAPDESGPDSLRHQTSPPKDVTGWTTHGKEQALNRDGGHGVSDEAINDAVYNPLSPPEPQPDGRFKYVGKNAVVVLNSEGRLITAWPLSSSAWRNP